jgi:TRAP-type C4-dicarboxylate transport system permease small subunit
VARWLERASAALALAGGLVLLAAAMLAGVSIAGRWLADVPIAGDIELMQVACAVSIALFLPRCQLHAGHVIVDFFTLRAAAATRRGLDRAGHALTAIVMLLLAWRAGVGVAEMKAVGETTMVLGVPTWITYLAMVPGLLLSAAVAMHAVFLPAAADERAAGP